MSYFSSPLNPFLSYQRLIFKRDSTDKANWIKAFKKLNEIKFDSLISKNEIDNFKSIGVSLSRSLDFNLNILFNELTRKCLQRGLRILRKRIVQFVKKRLLWLLEDIIAERVEK